MSTPKEIPPYYTMLQPSLPDAAVNLPDVRIDKSVAIDHKSQLEQLRSNIDTFNDRSKFWLEVSTLDRLHYKNLNQQRPFKRFQRGMEVRRIVKRLKTLDMGTELERLYKSFWNVKTLENCEGSRNYIPSKESIQYTMHRLIANALLLDKLKITLVETYRANTTLLRLEHFVSLALVYMGICSRLYKLSHIWLSQIEECYHSLYKWSLSFPSGLKAKKQEAFLASNNLHCDADTLKLARSKQLQELSKLKSSHQHKIHLESYILNPTIMEKVQALKTEVRGLEKNTVNVVDTNDDLMDFEDLGEVIQR